MRCRHEGARSGDVLPRGVVGRHSFRHAAFRRRYGHAVTTEDVLVPRRRQSPPVQIPACRGLWVEHRGSGFVGVVDDIDRRHVTLKDDTGMRRLFPLDRGAYRLVETGTTVTLVAPTPPKPQAPAFTASGAVTPPPAQPAKVARASRILVEGTHDAELIEKVWGDELRADGIVVEPIGGADNLAAEVHARRPGSDARLGVLLDHLVPGSKESRIAGTIDDPDVLITGHPYVDVWQAVRPHVVGLARWPDIDRSQEWKQGICTVFGTTDATALWRRIRNSVRDYRDLEPPFVGAVERLLDFLLTPEETDG